jgi:cytochrome c oxidase assembly protein subunit 15
VGIGVNGVGWPHRLARLTAGATVALIVAGGLVTNTGAALAVPDWPTTFGHNLFLFPWSGMVGGVLVEHGHRLLAASIGLLTVLLGVALRLGDARRWVWGLGVVAVGLVSVQGLIGGLRVVLLRETLALVHGGLAQLFFALLVGIAVVTGREWRTPSVVPADLHRLTSLAYLAVAVVYGQILLGAFTTHGPAVWWHVAGAVVTTGVLAGVALAVLRGAWDDPVLAWWARAVEGLLLIQLLLGVGAYAVRFTGLAVPGGQVAVVALPVLHRAVGALVLGSTVALALQLGRRRALGVLAPAAVRAVDTRTEAMA